MRPISIAIDGPAGAGKSSVTKALAKSLGYVLLDTGAMYRSITLYSLQNKGEIAENQLSNIDFEIRHDNGEYRYFLNSQNVTDEIRSERVTLKVSEISALSHVRNFAVKLQRKLAEEAVSNGNGVILEGRDIGTTVLPAADLKIYLTASVIERARRRALENGTTPESQIPLIESRDYADENREFSPLRQADDAVVIDTSDLSFEQVLERLLTLVSEKIA